KPRPTSTFCRGQDQGPCPGAVARFGTIPTPQVILTARGDDLATSQPTARCQPAAPAFSRSSLQTPLGNQLSYPPSTPAASWWTGAPRPRPIGISDRARHGFSFFLRPGALAMRSVLTSDEDLVRRLPLPLAQLYRRAHNAKTALERHLTAFYLWEA